MGKTQSKRSVDITTEAKKGSEEEVTGKLEKIEDLDQKHVNGDATAQENNDAEKKDADESENDKDLTTEKSGDTPNGESGDQSNSITATTVNAAAGSDSPKEEVAAVAGNTATKEGSTAEEISPLSDESIKKSKKEKVKKKWSFRSISFGKKDKQKPAKTEDVDTAASVAAATTTVTNGDSEKAVAEEGASEMSKKDETGSDAAEAKATEDLENGEASEKELNGLKTPTPTEEKSAETVDVAAAATTVAAATNITNTTTTTTNETNTTTATSLVNVPTASNETAIENLTENKTAATAADATVEIAVTISNNASVLSNGGGDADKNGIAEALTNEDVNETIKSVQAEPDEVSAAIIENKSIPNAINDGFDGDKPHQNGTNGGEESEAKAEQSKSQIEEIANNALDIKENAAAEVTTQDLPVSCE